MMMLKWVRYDLLFTIEHGRPWLPLSLRISPCGVSDFTDLLGTAREETTIAYASDQESRGK